MLVGWSVVRGSQALEGDLEAARREIRRLKDEVCSSLSLSNAAAPAPVECGTCTRLLQNGRWFLDRVAQSVRLFRNKGWASSVLHMRAPACTRAPVARDASYLEPRRLGPLRGCMLSEGGGSMIWRGRVCRSLKAEGAKSSSESRSKSVIVPSRSFGSCWSAARTTTTLRPHSSAGRLSSL